MKYASKYYGFTVLVLAFSGCQPTAEDTASRPDTTVKTTPVEVKTPTPALKSFFLQGADKSKIFREIEGTTVRVIEDGVVLSSSLTNPSSSRRTQSPYITVPKDIEAKLVGETVIVTLTAKTGEPSKNQAFAVAYSTNSNGNSGWKPFTATSEFQEFSVEYKIRNTPVGKTAVTNNDYIGVNPDTTGLGGSLIVKDVKLDILQVE